MLNEAPAQAAPARAKLDVTHAALFFAFLKMGLLGFGGVAPWVRQVIVEERRWMDDREFAALLGLSQILPGANTLNTAVLVGDRFRGISGAAAAVFGLMAMPLAIAVAIVELYGAVSQNPYVAAAIAGAGAGAAGLVIGTGLKIARNLKLSLRIILVTLVTFVAVGILRLPLVWVILCLVPLSIAAAYWDQAP
ncbi:MAG: chromate transporter [Methylobacteriaceae bacterium]|nr:chromate transporter [Methylobacteriaceae bacterium]